MGLLFYQQGTKGRNRIKFRQRFVLTSFLKACISFAVIGLFTINHSSGQEPLLEKTISIPKQHTSLYEALNLISQKAGVFFIYDSQVVESDKQVKLLANSESLKQVLDRILANPLLDYKVIGQHILIYRKTEMPVSSARLQTPVPAKDTIRNILIKGYIYDNKNKEPIPYATIGILEQNIGTISNNDGFFTLKVPVSFSGSSLIVSHLGFMNQRIPIQLLEEQKVDIYLEERIISIQEVIIRYIDPDVLIEKAMKSRVMNNSSEPVYMTSFYREGVEKNSKYISYSEAIFKVYKSPYMFSENADQVKLLKSRKIQNVNPRDTVYLKLKAGVLSALQLDIVKCVPGFLDLLPPKEYSYTYSDLVSYNSQDAYAITFGQDEGINKALYAGTIYIDKESFAILGADFEINPKFIDLAAGDLVLKKSRRLIVKLEKISYSISYTPYNGKYYLNHVRCDIKLKTRLRHHLSSDNFSTFLELATCTIDTANVVKFPKQEVLKPNAVFSDAPYSSDDTFWGDYNIISPEARLSEALSKIIGKIEEIR